MQPQLQWFRSIQTRVLEWCSESPDLNPSENLQEALKIPFQMLLFQSDLVSSIWHENGQRFLNFYIHVNGLHYFTEYWDSSQFLEEPFFSY